MQGKPNSKQTFVLSKFSVQMTSSGRKSDRIPSIYKLKCIEMGFSQSRSFFRTNLLLQACEGTIKSRLSQLWIRLYEDDMFYQIGWSRVKLAYKWLVIRNGRSPEAPLGSEILSFFSFYSRLLADFLSHLENWSNLRLKTSVSALWRLKEHTVPHLHPNFTMFMPLDRLQL